MTLYSKIEWTDHSWNPWIGCRKVSEGCQNCYMFREQKRYGNDPADIHRTSKSTWRNVRKMESGSKVFVCSWSDFFIGEADPWRDDAWGVIESRKDLTWILCTKRPENIKGRLPWDKDPWPHVIGMVTAENQARADERIYHLHQNPFATYGVSVEPMLGPIDLSGWLTKPQFGEPDENDLRPFEIVTRNDLIHWIICGAESGPDRRVAEKEWIRDLLFQCMNAKVPFFLKQADVDGKLTKMPMFYGHVWDECPSTTK